MHATCICTYLYVCMYVCMYITYFSYITYDTEVHAGRGHETFLRYVRSRKAKGIPNLVTEYTFKLHKRAMNVCMYVCMYEYAC